MLPSPKGYIKVFNLLWKVCKTNVFNINRGWLERVHKLAQSFLKNEMTWLRFCKQIRIPKSKKKCEVILWKEKCLNKTRENVKIFTNVKTWKAKVTIRCFTYWVKLTKQTWWNIFRYITHTQNAYSLLKAPLKSDNSKSTLKFD